MHYKFGIGGVKEELNIECIKEGIYEEFEEFPFNNYLIFKYISNFFPNMCLFG